MDLKMKLFSKRDKGRAAKASIKPAPSILQRAHKDWKILLLSAVVVALVVVAADMYLLWRLNNGNIFTTETVAVTDTTLADKRMLTGVVKFFEDRTAAFENFKNTPRTEIDPSL